MKVLKVSKYQALEAVKPIIIYYSILVVIITFLSAGSATFTGIEFSTVIFLFIAGLNSFKSQFMMTQANNISRKTFLKGSFFGMVAITLGMSIVDLIINRVFNIFERCPTFFDMIYGNYRDLSLMADINSTWIQANDFKTLLGTIIWQFAVYSVIYILGFLISLSYYKSNPFMKFFISGFSVVFFVVFMASSSILNKIILNNFGINIGQFLASILGWQSRNPYIAVFSLAVIGSLLSTVIYFFMKKTVVKE